MFRKIVGTFITRTLTTLIGFVAVMLNANNLGAGGLGTISLIVLGITIIIMIGNFLGGGAIIYLVPRLSPFRIALASCAWSVAASVLVTCILHLFSLIPRDYSLHIFALSLINCLSAVNLNILMGKERISAFNLITLGQSAIMLITLGGLFFLAGRKEVMSYLLSLYASYLFGLAAGLGAVWKYLRPASLTGLRGDVREMLRYGFYVQMAAFIQLLNFRLSYYIISSYFGKAMLGVYSVGVQLSEGLWLISKSIATVQYARVANAGDTAYSKDLTVKLAKISFLLTLGLWVLLALMPLSLFRFLFGAEFGDVRLVIRLMGAGIVAVSVFTVFVHYFSGTGRHYLNTLAALLSLAMTAALGFILIPRFGLAGAALTATFAYLSHLAYSLVFFIRKSGIRAGELWLKASDLKTLAGEFKTLFKAH